MNINKILNDFDRYYGKTHIIDNAYCYDSCVLIRLKYDVGRVMVKIWIKENKPDYIKSIKPTYNFILFKDNIYTNDYLMENKEDIEIFYKSLSNFLGNYTEYILGSWDIDLDGKILRLAYKNNHEQISQYSEVIKNRDVYNQSQYKMYDYKEALRKLEYAIICENALGDLIENKIIK